MLGQDHPAVRAQKVGPAPAQTHAEPENISGEAWLQLLEQMGEGQKVEPRGPLAETFLEGIKRLVEPVTFHKVFESLRTGAYTVNGRSMPDGRVALVLILGGENAAESADAGGLRVHWRVHEGVQVLAQRVERLGFDVVTSDFNQKWHIKTREVGGRALCGGAIGQRGRGSALTRQSSKHKEVCSGCLSEALKFGLNTRPEYRAKEAD